MEKNTQALAFVTEERESGSSQAVTLNKSVVPVLTLQAVSENEKARLNTSLHTTEETKKMKMRAAGFNSAFDV